MSKSACMCFYKCTLHENLTCQGPEFEVKTNHIRSFPVATHACTSMLCQGGVVVLPNSLFASSTSLYSHKRLSLHATVFSNPCYISAILGICIDHKVMLVAHILRDVHLTMATYQWQIQGVVRGCKCTPLLKGCLRMYLVSLHAKIFPVPRSKEELCL